MVCLGFAKLNNRQLSEIKKVEDKLGIILVGYEKPPEPASLNPNQLKQLRMLEKEMGVRLVAYQ